MATGLNADRVDGRSADELTAAAAAAARPRWLLLDEQGRIEEQSGGFTVLDAYQTDDNVYVDAGSSLEGKGLTATIALQNKIDRTGDGAADPSSTGARLHRPLPDRLGRVRAGERQERQRVRRGAAQRRRVGDDVGARASACTSRSRHERSARAVAQLADGPGGQHRLHLRLVVAELGQHLARVLAQRRGRARASGSAGVRESLTGAPSTRTGAGAPGWSSSTTIPRARTSSESSASSSSSTGSTQQSCSPANAAHSARVRAANTASDLAVGVRPRRRRTGARSGPRGRRRDTTPPRTSARAPRSVTQPSAQR